MVGKTNLKHRSFFPNFWCYAPTGFNRGLSRIWSTTYSMAMAHCPVRLPSLRYNTILSRPREAQAWLHPFSALFQDRYNPWLSHFSSFQENFFTFLLPTLFQSALKCYSRFDYRLHHFIPPAGSLIPSIISVKSPVLSLLAGSILKLVCDILNVTLQLSHAEIYFWVFKVWLFKSWKLYYLWIAQYTLLSPLPPQAGCKCSPRSGGKNQSNKKIYSLH